MDTTKAAYDKIAHRWMDDQFISPDNGIRQHHRALSFLPETVDGFALNVGCGCNQPGTVSGTCHFQSNIP